MRNHSLGLSESRTNMPRETMLRRMVAWGKRYAVPMTQQSSGNDGTDHSTHESISVGPFSPLFGMAVSADPESHELIKTAHHLSYPLFVPCMLIFQAGFEDR